MTPLDFHFIRSNFSEVLHTPFLENLLKDIKLDTLVLGYPLLISRSNVIGQGVNYSECKKGIVS